MGEVVQFRNDSFAAQFAEYWAVYPRKVGKLDAQKALKKALKLDTFENIMSGLRSYKWPEDKQFIPYPATWLNAGRWMDEVEKPQSPDESKRWDHLANMVKKRIRSPYTCIGRYELDYLLASGRITEEEKRKW